MLSQRASEAIPCLSPAVGTSSRVWVTVPSLRTRRRPPLQSWRHSSHQVPHPRERRGPLPITGREEVAQEADREPPPLRPVRHIGDGPSGAGYDNDDDQDANSDEGGHYACPNRWGGFR